jgi:ubiquinone/menaquinone biosynthesis C-methylase UbiE
MPMQEAEDIKVYKQQLLRDFNNRTNYDNGRFHAPVTKRLIELAQLESGQKILDIATGTGLAALAAAKIVGASGRVTGVDFSVGMLKNAMQKQVSEGLQNVEFIEADAEYVSFENNTFDRILCSLAISYLTNIPAALYKWYSFLKSDGILAFNTLAETAFPPSILFREVAARYGVTVPNPNVMLGTIEKCQGILESVGFRDIQIEAEQQGWFFTPDVKTAEELWKMNAINVNGYQVDQLSSDELERCKREYVAEIQAFKATDKGVWCDAMMFFAIVRK